MNNFVSLTRAKHIEKMKFSDLFNLTEKIDLNCNQCENNAHIKQKSFIIPETLKFLIIKLNLAEIAVDSPRLTTRIIDFSTDIISIPGTTEKFILRSAIEHMPADYKNSNEGGHFVCWTRLSMTCENGQNKWMRISDEFAEERNSLPSFLNDIYFLLFEKIE